MMVDFSSLLKAMFIPRGSGDPFINQRKLYPVLKTVVFTKYIYRNNWTFS